MTSEKLRDLFIKFFISKKHRRIPSASLIPENDPTVLFTTAGMHPLVPYLMGQDHPLGRRLCSIQKCLRTDDIEEVGDLRHFTFFEMMGNWSLGDYFKKEAIEWSFEFLTAKKWLGLDPKKIYVSVFEGDNNVSKDNDSIGYWQETFKKVGIEAKVGDYKKPTIKKNIIQERIFCYRRKENWWGPAGQTGPCGPDTEIFYDTGLAHDKKFGIFCHPNCNCGRFVEIWNDVFMEFNKKNNGEYEPLKQKNVDTGMGLERMLSILEFIEGKLQLPDPFSTELFKSVIRIIESATGKNYRDFPKQFRIILDHLRAAVFLTADGVEPANKDRGYILRRLIRRAVFAIYQLNETISLEKTVRSICQEYIKIYSLAYSEIKNANMVMISQEVNRFLAILNKGLKLLNKFKIIDGKLAFDLFQTHGIPWDLTYEIALAKGQEIKKSEFKKQYLKHQQLSRSGAAGKFSGGLQDHSEMTTKLHTATHLLHSALRKILGSHVYQVGSHITAERLRFDFTHKNKLSDFQIKKIENLVNEQIKKNLPVKMEVMSLNEAKKKKALALFGQKYPSKVKVYFIEEFSAEVCGGPHSDFTGNLGNFKIIKEEGVGAGKRRIYAKLN